MHTNNVEGTERLLSLVIGAMGVKSGIQQGGVGGLLKIALGAMLAKRGLTGHCQLKGLLSVCERENTHNERNASVAERNQESVTSKSTEHAQDRESRMDNALEETFPASDPISP